MLVDEDAVIRQRPEAVAVKFFREEPLAGAEGVRRVDDNKVVLFLDRAHEFKAVLKVEGDARVVEFAGGEGQQLAADLHDHFVDVHHVDLFDALVACELAYRAAVAAADPKGSIGMMAAINQADLLQRQGKYAEALAVFDSLEKSAPESLRPAILEGQAMSAELAGKLDRALAAYESIATSLGDAANNGYFQAKIAELKARMAS